MDEHSSPALEVALAYYHAWIGKDIDKAMTHVADDVVCDNPIGKVEGVEALRGFMTPFAAQVTGSELVAAYGDAERAMIMYNPRTQAVPDAPSAELFTVRHGKIVHSLLVFDRTPFDAARKKAN
jgi:hypothetical protein